MLSRRSSSKPEVLVLLDALLLNYLLYTSFLNPSEPLDLCLLLTCPSARCHKTPKILHLISPTVRIYSWLDTVTDQGKTIYSSEQQPFKPSQTLMIKHHLLSWLQRFCHLQTKHCDLLSSPGMRPSPTPLITLRKDRDSLFRVSAPCEGHEAPDAE